MGSCFAQLPGHRSKNGSEMVLNGGDYVSELTLVQPEGIPPAPVLQLVEEGVTNVPVDATPSTQRWVQSLAEMSVARHLM